MIQFLLFIIIFYSNSIIASEKFQGNRPIYNHSSIGEPDPARVAQENAKEQGEGTQTFREVRDKGDIKETLKLIHLLNWRPVLFPPELELNEFIEMRKKLTVARANKWRLSEVHRLLCKNLDEELKLKATLPETGVISKELLNELHKKADKTALKRYEAEYIKARDESDKLQEQTEKTWEKLNKKCPETGTQILFCLGKNQDLFYDME